MTTSQQPYKKHTSVDTHRDRRGKSRAKIIGGAVAAVLAACVIVGSPAHAAVVPVFIPSAPSCQSVTSTSGGTTWQQQLAGDYGTPTTWTYLISSRPTRFANYGGTANVAISQQPEYLATDGRYHAAGRFAPTQIAYTYPTGSYLQVSGWTASNPTFNAIAGRRYAVLTRTIWMTGAGRLLASHVDLSVAAQWC